MSFRRVVSRLLALALTSALGSFGAVALAQTPFPSKPVRIIVPSPPGQATGVIARLVADELAQIWGQQVIVDDRGGGAGIPATVAGRDAPADGYTVTFVTLSTAAVNPSIYSKLPYDPLRDFAFVNAVFGQAWVIVAHPGTTYGTLKEMVGAAKKAPGKLNWGYGATALQMGGELFAYRAGIDIVGVAYRGSGPAMIDLVGGHIPLLVDTLTSALPNVKQGKIKILAVMSEQRAPQLPSVPTVAELGYPGFHGSGWGGLVVPKATPNDIVDRISADVRRALSGPLIQQRFTALGAVLDSRGPQEWTAFVRAETTKWAEVVRRNPGLRQD